MKSAPIPSDEEERIARLQRYEILDTPGEDAFDRITRIVAATLDVPIALISLVDRNRQWFKSKQGLSVSETPRNLAFCAHAILGDSVFEVNDASQDERFADNPLVVNDPAIRFYAGAPLTAPDGHRIGTLCAIGREPRQLTDDERQLLTDLATLAVDEMELRVAIKSAMEETALEVKKRTQMDKFVSLVSHELRTPLTSIIGALSLVGSGKMGTLPKAISECILIANRNANTLVQMVNDLLDFQKLHAQNMEFSFETVDVSTLFQEACENMAGMATSQNVNIQTDITPDAIVMVDPVRLTQVMTNLLSNAIKFSPVGQQVTASLSIGENRVNFSVLDLGPGVPEEFGDQIFQKFSQAPGDKKSAGTGLGLAICKAIIDVHSGAIHYENGPEVGTTFHVELPVRQIAGG